MLPSAKVQNSKQRQKRAGKFGLNEMFLFQAVREHILTQQSKLLGVSKKSS